MNVKKMLSVARGDELAELVIRNVIVPNVFTFEMEEVDVAVSGGIIAGVGHGYRGQSEVKGNGAVLIPGFMDGHCHIESTMLSPEGFADLVLKRGTTTVLADPHEIANTCGLDGLEYMYRASSTTPIDIFLNAPSCVPASQFETPREELDAMAIEEVFARGWCRGLGEVMNYPGVIFGDDSLWSKLFASGKQVRTGHAPGVRGKELCAYLLSGCNSDHESVTYEEGLEKLRRGMWLMIREGATEHNLAALARIILEDERRASRSMIVSDDLNARYLLERGHMDEKMRLAVGLGISPVVALRMMTLSVAEYYGFRDRGAVAPGFRADLVLVDSLEKCRVERVWKKGRLVVDDGRLVKGHSSRSEDYPRALSKISLPGPEDLQILEETGKNIRVIGINEGQVVTSCLEMVPTIRDGIVVTDVDRDLAKMTVVNRNTEENRHSLGFVRGSLLKRGAIASSVAHDAHNYVAIGMDDCSMATALQRLGHLGGGFVVADGDKVLADLPLPVGGLMSTELPERLVEALDNVEQAARSLGTTLEHPFMVMSFLSLSVIPELKLTDRGYVDLGHGGLLSLFV